MLRILAAVAFLALPAVGFGDGPGSRIRAGPPAPQRPSPAAQRDLDRCAAMRSEEKERCMKDVRAAAAADESRRGPEASGAGSSAGSGASPGASGGTFGNAAPR